MNSPQKRRLVLALSTHLAGEALMTMAVHSVQYRQDLTSDGDGSEPCAGLTNFDDVEAFHTKFGVPMAKRPAFLDVGGQTFRVKFMQEELDEFCDACMARDMAKAADALVDLVYVAMGTASMMGVPWQEIWDEVQRANMSKQRALPSGENSVRKSPLDVIKPPGWKAPDHSAALTAEDGDVPPPVWPTVRCSDRNDPTALIWPDGFLLSTEQQS